MTERTRFALWLGCMTNAIGAALLIDAGIPQGRWFLLAAVVGLGYIVWCDAVGEAKR